MFEVEKLGKMKTKDLEEILAAYHEAGVALPTESFRNNAERVEFIKGLADENGVPHIVTEEDLEANPELREEGVEIGATILMALDDEEEEEGDEGGEDKKDDEGGDQGGSEEGQDGAGGDEGGKDGEDTDEDKSDAPEGSEEATEETPAGSLTDEEINKALASGRVRYENQTIVAQRPRVTGGKLYRELDSGAARYLVSVDVFERVIRGALQ